MKKLNSKKGFSIIESLVCLVIIGIGFVAINQLTGHAIQSVDRSIEKNKVNFLAEMIVEDMIGNPTAAISSGFGSFDERCTYNNKGGDSLLVKQHNKWVDKLKAKQQIKINNSFIIAQICTKKNKDLLTLLTIRFKYITKISATKIRKDMRKKGN